MLDPHILWSIPVAIVIASMVLFVNRDGDLLDSKQRVFKRLYVTRDF